MNNNIKSEQQFIRSIAAKIHQSGFITPVIFFLELSETQMDFFCDALKKHVDTY